MSRTITQALKVARGPFTVGSYGESRAAMATADMKSRIEAAITLGRMVRDKDGNRAPVELPPALALAILDLYSEPSAAMFVTRQSTIDEKAHR